MVNEVLKWDPVDEEDIMFAWNDTYWEKASVMSDAAMAEVTRGIAVGTKVATPKGWKKIENVVEGNKVLTFDDGLQTVVRVQRHILWETPRGAPIAQWPLHVPQGALGNNEPMFLLPGQQVMVESDTAEEVLGDPFVLIPARVLEGYRGISPVVPQHKLEVVELFFENEQIVFANSGTLFRCDAAIAYKNDLYASTTEDRYIELDTSQADMLVGLLEIEDGIRRNRSMDSANS